MSIRVVLADDHAVLRDGLKLLFESQHMSVVGEADNGADAVGLARSLRPNVVVLDLSMPIMSGIEAVAQIRRELGIPCILLTMHSEEQFVLRAFRSGVAGYVLKSKAASDLLQAVQEVSRGNAYLSPGISRIVIQEMLNKDGAPDDSLTLRERQVLQLIAEGHSNKRIAQHLGISTRTGESHRARLMEKLDIHEIAGLVRFAIRDGLIQA